MYNLSVACPFQALPKPVTPFSPSRRPRSQAGPKTRGPARGTGAAGAVQGADLGRRHHEAGRYSQGGERCVMLDLWLQWERNELLAKQDILFAPSKVFYKWNMVFSCFASAGYDGFYIFPWCQI